MYILDSTVSIPFVNYETSIITVLKELLEKQIPLNVTDVDNDDGGGESKKRYLILISTLMTWAVTKPLDPVRPVNGWTKF